MKRFWMVLLVLAMMLTLCSCGGGSSSSYSNGGGSGGKGYGGYDMPNSNDKTVVDYIKRVDPDLWNSMESNWGNW